MFAARFLAVDGLRGTGAIAYLLGSLVLLFAVSVAGYFGGEMTENGPPHATELTPCGVRRASRSA
jgi:hypothetical protein